MNAEQIIKDILLNKKIIKTEEEFIPSAELETLDIDSLDLLDIVFEAEGIIQIKFPDIKGNPPKTLQDVIDLVQGLIDNPPPVNPHHVNLEGIPHAGDILKEMTRKEREQEAQEKNDSGT
jgi:acyl carrier protein